MIDKILEYTYIPPCLKIFTYILFIIPIPNRLINRTLKFVIFYEYIDYFMCVKVNSNFKPLRRKSIFKAHELMALTEQNLI